MIEPYRMMQKLHSKLLEDTAAAQAKVLHLRQLRGAFGDDAVPPDKLLQGYNNALTNAPENITSLIQRYEESIAENLEAIRSAEKVFAERERDHAEAFGEWLREHMRHGK